MWFRIRRRLWLWRHMRHPFVSLGGRVWLCWCGSAFQSVPAPCCDDTCDTERHGL